MVVQEREREEDDVLAKILRLPASRAQTECRPARALGAGTANLTVEESGSSGMRPSRAGHVNNSPKERGPKPKADGRPLYLCECRGESYLYISPAQAPKDLPYLRRVIKRE